MNQQEAFDKLCLINDGNPIEVEEYNDFVIVRGDIITSPKIESMQKEFRGVFFDGHFNGLVCY